jgi:uncharacterized protein YceK
MFGALLVLTLLNGCVTTVISSTASVVGAGASAIGAYFDWKTSEATEPVVVVPKIDQYSASVQDQMATELEKLSEPCPRDIENVSEDCSVTARFIIDYGDLRNRIRAADQK